MFDPSAASLAGMAFDTWLAFLFTSLVTAFTPGQAVVLAVSNTLALGRRRALLGSLGNAAGLLVLGAATLSGMGLLLRAWPPLFDAVKLAGAGYLVWMGVQPWLAKPPLRSAPARAGSVFLQGLLVALANPKAILFFAALFPQFVPAGRGLSLGFVVMMLTFVACALTAHVCYIALAPWSASRLGQGRGALLARRAGGILFIALGLGMLRLHLPPA